MILEEIVSYLRDNVLSVDRKVFPLRSKDCKVHPHINVHYDPVKQKCIGANCENLYYIGVITLDVWGDTKKRGDLFTVTEEVEDVITRKIKTLWNGSHKIHNIHPTKDWEPIDIKECDQFVYQRQYKITYQK